MLGSTTPRLWTPPRRELTPETSVGFAQADFARNVLRRPLDPWQEWLVVHAGELLPDGRPRFHKVLVIVARQNGKTEVPVILSLYWLFVDRWPLVLGTSTKLDYAQESWEKAIKIGKPIKALWKHVPRRGGVRRANGEQVLRTDYDTRYKIAASNEEGGRSLSVDRLVLDELRQHKDYSAWDASVPATSARWLSQVWALTNAGGEDSVVLNDLREQALAHIEWVDEHGYPQVGELLPAEAGDWRTGIFEWSAPETADPLDLDALAQANPNMGRRLDPEQLQLEAAAAVKAGGRKLVGFKTEKMCITVPSLDPAIDPLAWAAGAIEGDLAQLRARVAMFVDVAPDLQHATAAAAAKTPEGKIRTEIVAAWSGATAVQDMIDALPELVARVKPRAFGWMPGAPAAAAAAKLADRQRKGEQRRAWPPPGVLVEEIKLEAPAVCMGFAAAVAAVRILHAPDALADAHVLGAEKLPRGDVWVFSRRPPRPGAPVPHVDAAYAIAGAAHLAETMPAAVGVPRFVPAG